MAKRWTKNGDVDLDNASILVTGGTGSFGRAFIKGVLDRYRPRRLIVFSRDELKQYEMQQEFNPKDYECLRYFIGDVRDRDRLQMAMRDVDIVVHAAALKHVTVAEYNPTECIRTNVNGAENVAMAAIDAKVKVVVALSTDKAVNPINLYGASKLASDKIFVAANHLAGHNGTRFAVVRYGNVVGSRGSVVPFFQKLVREGATRLPITDDRMTRFWITLPRGVEFVLSCINTMRGGEVFVPKLKSMRVVDLAKALAPNLDYEIIGIRPGEKIHEVLITEDDAPYTWEFSDRYVIEPAAALFSREPVGGRPVADRFRYASDGNAEWIDVRGLQSMLQEAGCGD